VEPLCALPNFDIKILVLSSANLIAEFTIILNSRLSIF
jgi:hypothetical protein